MTTMHRTLAPGQRCEVWIHEVASGGNTLLLSTSEILLEAPNWTLDGSALILNGNGTLWRLPVDASRGTPEPAGASALAPIPIAGVLSLNNDHVLDPDGEHIFLSANEDGQLYRAPLAGGDATPVTGPGAPAGLLHFLHGVSPDGRTLAFVGLRRDPAVADEFRVLSAEIFTVGADGTGYRQVTDSGAPADGPEYSPDGAWIYCNTEAFTGHAQIARIRPDGSGQERLTFTETVDWFPHLAPNGRVAVYLAFPPGTAGHPADRWVELLVVHGDAWRTPVRAARIFGGQGTINVNSWAPDSTRFAYVAYPLDA